MRKTTRTPTPWVMDGEPFTDANGYYGFIYLITCHHPLYKGKMYIGMKYFYVNYEKKTKVKDSNWRSYKTSSKKLEPLIKELGTDQFTFEILQVFETRGGVRAGECKAQWECDVLTARDADGERLYWNEAIGDVKFIPKETLSEETKAKMRRAHLGKPCPWNNGNQYGLGYKHTEEAKAKISATHKGSVHNPEVVAKRNAAISDSTVRTFTKASEVFTGTTQELRTFLEPRGEWNSGLISQVISGKRKQHKGWRLQ